MERLLLFLRGLLMGVADSIPGVSGGTIAFISGIYERLISAVRALSGDFPGHLFARRWRLAFQSLHLSFFFPLLLGIAVGLVGMSHLLARLFSSELVRTALLALFFGLVLASALFCARRVQIWSWSRWALLIAGAVGAFYCVGALDKGGSSRRLYDVQLPVQVEEVAHLARAVNYQPFGRLLLNVPEQTLARMVWLGKVEPEALIYNHTEVKWQRADQLALAHPSSWIDLRTVAVGAIAACAMLLPGISGAFVLHVAGDYEPALMALARVTSGEFDGVGLLVAILIGFLSGLLLFARLIHWLFRRYADSTTALLIGLMIGALRSLWPFWSYQWALQPLQLELQLEPLSPVLPDLSRPLFWGILLIAIQGVLLFLLIEALAHKLSQRRSL